MAERWACPRCSNENESWAITCSKCGMLRQDLSIRPPPIESPGQDQPVSPSSITTVASVPDATPTPQAATAPASRTGPMFSPSPAASGVPAADATLAATIPRPAPVPIRRRIPLQWVLVGAFLLVPAISGLIANASRAPGGEIVKGGDLNASALRVGDCFDLKDPKANEIGDVHAVPCTAEHEYETYFTGAMPAGTFPTEAAMNDWITGHCEPAFRTYVGVAYEQSRLEDFNFTPSREAWDGGDRSIQCNVSDPTIHRLTESLKGSDR
jgi:putative regulator of septum formation